MALNVSLLRESFEAIKPHALDVMEHFYKELFTRYPAAKGLFKVAKMKGQYKALATSLTYIIDNVENGEQLTKYLNEMGARHNAYNTEPEHYAMVGEALLATLEYYFDSQWTNELADTWATAFGVIQTEMLKGMQSNKVVEIRKEEETVPSIKETTKKLAEEMFKSAIEEEFKSQSCKDHIRNQVQELIKRAIDEESKRLINDLRVGTKKAA